MKLCNLILTAGLLFSAAASAEFVETDRLVEGDAQATLDTETGLEWLDISVTRGFTMELVIERTQKGGDLEGWRLPTQDEVYTMFAKFFPYYTPAGSGRVDYHKNSQPEIEADAQYFTSLFGATHSVNTTYGMFYENDGEVANLGQYAFSQVLEVHYDQGASYSTVGVYLVSDGGTTLDSINNPEINQANPNSPYAQNVSAPMVGSLALGLLGAGGLSRRKKKS